MRARRHVMIPISPPLIVFNLNEFLVWVKGVLDQNAVVVVRPGQRLRPRLMRVPLGPHERTIYVAVCCRLVVLKLAAAAVARGLGRLHVARHRF